MVSRSDRFGGLYSRAESEIRHMGEYRETLRGHGHEIFLRDRFQCRYCGFDGREFLGWMRLSLDHIPPREAGGSDHRENLVTCCRSCNSITSRMSFGPGVTLAQVIEEKCARVRKRHADCLEFWKAEVVQSYLSPCAGSLAQSRSAVGCSVSESTPPVFITPPKDAMIPSKEPGHGIANSNHST